MVDANQQRPVIFLPEGAKRTRGREAQEINILVAKAVADAVKSTLGPKGMDKMIVDELGDVIISNDGATILEEMSIDHPAGKMMVEVAKTQDDEVGDGTTTAVVLAGELLNAAQKLLHDNIHPSIVVKGYRIASRKAVELANKTADDIKIGDKATLKLIAKTTMTGKSAEAEDKLSELVVTAVLQVADDTGKEIIIDKDMIKVEKQIGGSLGQSEIIQGIVIDKEVVHSGMPTSISEAKIALVDTALEIKETETDAEIRISDPDQLQAFLEKEENMLRNMVQSIKDAGANVLLCQKGIDDVAQHFLAKEGILTVRRVKKSDMEKLAKATGGRVIARIADISKADLGNAKNVEQRKISGEAFVFVEGCKNPKSVTLLLRGGSEHVVDEAERAIEDAMGTVSSALRDGKVVTGGGATEMEVSMRLREFAKSIGGKEQLAIESFSDALETIPKALAESAGMDPIDTLVNLRSKHAGKTGKDFGINVYKGSISDMKKEKVIEPLRVKTQALMSGSEVAEMILRIDDIVAGTGRSKAGQDMGGMPPMGGMSGM